LILPEVAGDETAYIYYSVLMPLDMAKLGKSEEDNQNGKEKADDKTVS